MIKELKENWTIVINGSWNISIFNPAWLSGNIFKSKEVTLEIGLEPGLTRRLIGDNVVIIPRPSRLMFTPNDLEDSTLKRMEEIACTVLEVLKHTPVSAVGINFGYSIKPVQTNLDNKLPKLFSAEFAKEELIIESREYKWTCQYEKQTLNVSYQADGKEAKILFNFHSDLPDASSAAKHISGKVISFRDKTRAVLDNVFDVTLEDKS